MAKRKSLNKRFSRYNRSSDGSNVLNPDTGYLGEEHPLWWRNLENNTIIRPSTDSTNFNQTSRHLNSNSSIRTSNNLDDSWWKVLEGTPRNLKSLQKVNDLSKKDANNGASETSESEEEVKIMKKKPCLQSEAKKVHGNAFLSVLKNLKVSLIPLEEDPAFQKSNFAQGFVSTSRISNDSKQPNKVSDTELSSSGSPGIVAKPKPKILQKNVRNRNANAFEGDKLTPTLKRMSLRKSLPTDKRFSIAADSPVIAAAINSREAQKSLTESDHDLSNCPVPKATSTILGSSSLSQQNSVGNSNSDTEPVVIKPKSKLLIRRDKDTKKNLFKDILMEDKINEEKAADQPLFNASAVVDESAEEPEPRIEVDETTEELEPRIVEDESNDSSDTSSTFLEPRKPKSKFLRNMRSLKEILYQKIVDESDSSITKGTLSLSQNGNNKQTMRRSSVISANSNDCSEDVHLRLSNSSKASDIEIIKTGNNKSSSSRNSSKASDIEIIKTGNNKSSSSRNSNIEIASSQSKNQGRNVSFAADCDKEMSDNHSDVTLIIPPSNDFDRRQSKHMSSRLKLSIEDVANLKKGSVEIKDSAVAENVDDASDIVRDLNRSRKRSMSSSVQQIAVEEAAISQQRMKSQEHPGPAIFNENEPTDAENTERRQSQRQSSVRGAARFHFSTRFDSEDDGSDSSDDKPAGAKNAVRSRSQRLSNARRAESLFFTDGTEAEDDSLSTKSQKERARLTQTRVVSISSKEETKTSLLFFNNSDRDNSVVRTFLEKRSRNRDQSKQNSILDKEDDVDSAVKSPSVLPTGETGTENFRKPSSTSLKERSLRSRTRSKLSLVDLPEEIEKEDERTEVDHLRNVSSIAEELESTSPRRSTMQERFQTVPNTEKRSLTPRRRSRRKVEENIELERQSTARVATEEVSATPRKRDKVSIRTIRTITNLDASIGDVGVDRSLLRLAIDQNAVRVGSPSRDQSRPGPSGKSGSLRPLSLNRIEEELGSESVSKTETENRPKTVHGRTSNLKADSGKGKSSAIPQPIQKGQRNMKDFFNTNGTAIPASQALSNPQMAQEIRKKVDEIKKREDEKEMEEIRKLTVAAAKIKSRPRPRPKQPNSVPRKVDKAYLVNGVVYKQPRLPRPKRWVTDRLYQHLWKRMEPKFKLDTRVQSEKFICRLSEVTGVIAKRKTYVSYKNELYALMKEMARLQIIHNRHDFYSFCQDFLPYELCAKMVPILLPGNQRTIPYDPSKLYEPLLFSP